MRAAFKNRRNFSTMAFTAVSIAALSFTGCRAADGRWDTPAATAAPTVPETEESRPSDPAVPFTMEKELEPAQKGEELSWAGYVDIPAHIKELHEDHILIRSDADLYPGAFVVSGAQGATGSDVLTEGARIRIRMADLHKEDLQGLPCYRAEDILVLDDGDNEPDGAGDGTARVDILLTSAPVLTLSDPLSSTMNGLEVSSGSYTWTVLEEGQGQSIVACGSSPLDTAATDHVPRLALPRYNGMDHVLYSFYTTVSPDILTIRQWDGTAADEPVVTTCYQPLPFIELQAGKIYELSAEWGQDTADQNGFYGTASYVFVTE